MKLSCRLAQVEARVVRIGWQSVRPGTSPSLRRRQSILPSLDALPNFLCARKKAFLAGLLTGVVLDNVLRSLRRLVVF